MFGQVWLSYNRYCHKVKIFSQRPLKVTCARFSVTVRYQLLECVPRIWTTLTRLMVVWFKAQAKFHSCRNNGTRFKRVKNDFKKNYLASLL